MKCCCEIDHTNRNTSMLRCGAGCGGGASQRSGEVFERCLSRPRYLDLDWPFANFVELTDSRVAQLVESIVNAAHSLLHQALAQTVSHTDQDMIDICPILLGSKRPKKWSVHGACVTIVDTCTTVRKMIVPTIWGCHVLTAIWNMKHRITGKQYAFKNGAAAKQCTCVSFYLCICTGAGACVGARMSHCNYTRGNRSPSGADQASRR